MILNCYMGVRLRRWAGRGDYSLPERFAYLDLEREDDTYRERVRAAIRAYTDRHGERPSELILTWEEAEGFTAEMVDQNVFLAIDHLGIP